MGTAAAQHQPTPYYRSTKPKVLLLWLSWVQEQSSAAEHKACANPNPGTDKEKLANSLHSIVLKERNIPCLASLRGGVLQLKSPVLRVVQLPFPIETLQNNTTWLLKLWSLWSCASHGAVWRDTKERARPGAVSTLLVFQPTPATFEPSNKPTKKQLKCSLL